MHLRAARCAALVLVLFCAPAVADLLPAPPAKPAPTRPAPRRRPVGCSQSGPFVLAPVLLALMISGLTPRRRLLGRFLPLRELESN